MSVMQAAAVPMLTDPDPSAAGGSGDQAKDSATATPRRAWPADQRVIPGRSTANGAPSKGQGAAAQRKGAAAQAARGRPKAKGGVHQGMRPAPQRQGRGTEGRSRHRRSSLRPLREKTLDADEAQLDRTRPDPSQEHASDHP